MVQKNDLYQLICKGGLANESIFAIMLETYLELGVLAKHKIINSSSTLCNWDKMSTPTSPYLFDHGTQYDVDYIKNHITADTIFIRKISPNFPDKILHYFILNGKRPFKERWNFILFGVFYFLFLFLFYKKIEIK
jgi:hypothetical protein